MDISNTLQAVKGLSGDGGSVPSKRIIGLVAYCICLFIILAIMERSLTFLQEMSKNERVINSLMTVLNNTRNNYQPPPS